MARDITMLVAISVLSLGALLSTCLGAASAGSDPNRPASQATPADSNQPAGVEAGPAREQTPNKLLGWWRFDEADGNSVADASGNGREGTRIGNPQWRPDGGKIGGALEFDGNGDRVEIGDESAFDVTNAITIAAWIKVNTFNQRWQGLVTKGDSAWRLQRTAEEDTLAFHCDGIRSADPDWPMGIAGRKNINDGQWHHVVGVYDGAMASLYIDGTLDNSSPASGSIRTNDFAVVIGGNSEMSNRAWNGLIDEVCVFACALSDSDAKALSSGTDPMVVADSIQDRSPSEAVAVAVPEPRKKTWGRWLALAVVLVAGGLTASVYVSRRRWRMGLAATDMARRDLGGSLRHMARGVPGMTWKIARKEFLLNLMTFKFTVGTVVCIVLMAVFMPGLVNDYEERLQNYNGNIARNEAEFQKVKVYNNLTPTVYRAPAALSVFSKGIVDRLEVSERIDLDEVSGTETGVGEANTLLSVFPVMDVTLILKIVISVLALLMAYDVVSGEREQGTLRLILSNTTPRHQILLGKLVAGWMTLAVPVTAAFIIGLLILLTSNAVNLTGVDWLRIALMYLVSLIFVGSMFNLGLLLSSVSRNSAVSLVFVLFLWLIFTAILPNASANLAAQLKPIEPPEQFAARLKAITNQRDQEIQELAANIDGSEDQSESDAVGAFGNGLVLLCNKGYMDYHRQIYPITEPRKIQCIDKLLDVKSQYLTSLMRQKQLADTLSGITPIILCERLMSMLAGTDFGNFGSFKNRVRAYRHEVADYIRDKTGNFTSACYFTPYPEGEHEKLMEAYFKPSEEAQDEKVKAELYKSARQRYDQLQKDAPTLALEDFPKFTYRTQPLALTLQQAVPVIGLLTFEGILFFALAFVAFLRYDVR